MEATITDWAIFAVILFSLLFIDLCLQRYHHGTSRQGAIIWSIVWIGIGLFFSLYIQASLNIEARNQYISAYLIEKSLSIDNLFVFLMIFTAMKIPLPLQRIALEWGIFGALIFRAIFIFLGAAALERWAGVGIIFAFLLFYAGIQACFTSNEESPNGESKISTWLSKHLPVSSHLEADHLFSHEGGKWRITPLLMTIIALELTDIVFAVDSIPAALSFSSNTFVVFSSNAFAILGLRALYVLLASLISNLKYLHFGLCGVLIFAGLKMVAHSCNTLLDPSKNLPAEAGVITHSCQQLPIIQNFDIDSLTSVFIIIFFIGTATIASLITKRKS